MRSERENLSFGGENYFLLIRNIVIAHCKNRNRLKYAQCNKRLLASVIGGQEPFTACFVSRKKVQ